eukprot:TRINITY_DN4452_c0_g1_i1.p1 TRINITY_DN4452_c0_g1~~TRINITY_DN4452_c0_g1_i1.p1  ORF type:complete len:426 (-),score=107.71 TRINITY_DN4452_c0_g1_i1:53-1201(-)
MEELVMYSLKQPSTKEDLLASVSEFIEEYTKPEAYVDWIWDNLVTLTSHKEDEDEDEEIELGGADFGTRKIQRNRLVNSSSKAPVKETPTPVSTKVDTAEENSQRDRRETRMKRFGVASEEIDRKVNDRDLEASRIPKTLPERKERVVPQRKVAPTPRQANNTTTEEENAKKRARQVKFTVTLGDNERTEEEPQVKRFKANTDDTQKNMKLNATATPFVPPQPTAKRCTFFPSCTRPDCPFFHPTEPCKNFPHCAFGKACRYVHPVCKFAGRCTRPNCAFEHPQESKVDCKFGFSCLKKNDKENPCPYKHSAELCRNGPKCPHKGRCLFSHAQPCKFGGDCRISGCSFGHVPTVEDANVENLSETLPQTPPAVEEIHQNKTD